MSLVHQSIAAAFCLILVFAGQLSLADKVSCRHTSPCPRSCQAHGKQQSITPVWQVVHSTNFTVCCPNGTDARNVSEACEAAREQLSSFWFGREAKSTWAPRCYVVLHPTAMTYVQAAGRGAERTSGCSTVQVQAGQVLSRRIDIRLDRPDPLTRTLPHELTHVILGDSAKSRALPRWAEEGMAMLADPADKRDGHRRDIMAALNQGAALRLPALLSMEGYPKPQHTAAFYGQSLSLVEFLVARKGPSILRQFLQTAAEQGYQKALDKIYDIQDPQELERLWLAHVYSDGSSSAQSLPVAAVLPRKTNPGSAEPLPATYAAPAVLQ